MRVASVHLALLSALQSGGPALREHAVSGVVLFSQSESNHAALVDNGLLPALRPLLAAPSSSHGQMHALCALLHLTGGRGRSHRALIVRAGMHQSLILNAHEQSCWLPFGGASPLTPVKVHLPNEYKNTARK